MINGLGRLRLRLWPWAIKRWRDWVQAGIAGGGCFLAGALSSAGHAPGWLPPLAAGAAVLAAVALVARWRPQEIEDGGRALLECAESYRQLVEGMNDGLCVLNKEGRVVYFNERFRQMAGRSAEGLMLIHSSEILVEEERDSFLDRWVKRNSQPGLDNRYEVRFARPDGEWTYALVSPKTLFDDRGEFLGSFAVVLDITDRRMAEKELLRARDELELRVEERTRELSELVARLQREIAERQLAESALDQSERRYRGIVEDQTELVCRFTPDGTLTFVNGAYARYFGEQRETLLGRSFLPLLPAEDQELLHRVWRRMTPAQPVVTYEHKVNTPHGEVRWHQWTDRAFFSAEGEIREFQGVGRDITRLKEVEKALREANEEMEHRVADRTRELTALNRELMREVEERRRAEGRLRVSEEKLRTVFDHSPDIITTTARDGRILYMNRGMAEIPVDEATGRDSAELMPSGYRARYQTALARAAQEGKVDQFVFATGSLNWWEVRTAPLRRGDEEAVLVIATDITEKRQLQEQAVRNARLASLGVLSAGVAHEINNPNNAIVFNASLMGRVWRDAQPILEQYHRENGDFALGGLSFEQERERFSQLLGEIGENARRIERIIANLKHLARQDRGAMDERTPAREVLEAALTILANEVRKRTDHFVLGETPDSLPLRGNRQQLEQVFINLILNALQSLPSRDRGVRVEAGWDESRRRVRVVVRDEGVGIAPENMGRILEPFFTTKLDAGGTGLGLAITHAIVIRHQGELGFESELGRGTTATVLLPAAPEEIPGE
ncbi:MAG: PAS domain S-box protein [Magnetococcales bacterium]|nr:PAS domain S-box protein [Magnetococcales bacterium]